MEYGVWLPIAEAPRDGTRIICGWTRANPDHGSLAWCELVWKHNPRTDQYYFGDPREMDDYDLAPVSAWPDVFMAIPPVPARVPERLIYTVDALTLV